MAYVVIQQQIWPDISLRVVEALGCHRLSELLRCD